MVLSTFLKQVQYAESVQNVSGEEWDDDTKKWHALVFMINNHHYSKNMQDSVLKLHALDGGAEIYDINLNSNTPDSKDGVEGLGVFINYRHPNNPQAIVLNKARVKAGDLPLRS